VGHENGRRVRQLQLHGCAVYWDELRCSFSSRIQRTFTMPAPLARGHCRAGQRVKVSLTGACRPSTHPPLLLNRLPCALCSCCAPVSSQFPPPLPLHCARQCNHSPAHALLWLPDPLSLLLLLSPCGPLLLPLPSPSFGAVPAPAPLPDDTLGSTSSQQPLNGMLRQPGHCGLLLVQYSRCSPGDEGKKKYSSDNNSLETLMERSWNALGKATSFSTSLVLSLFGFHCAGLLLALVLFTSAATVGWSLM